MGPALRRYLGITSDYRGDLSAKVSDEAAAAFGQALLAYAQDHQLDGRADNVGAANVGSAVLVNILEELVTMDMPAAALQMYAAHRDLFPVADFRAQFHLGNAAMLAGSLVQAEQAFIEAQKLVPGETAPYMNMAQILIHDRRFDEARAWIEAGLNADANHCGLWELLAWVFEQMEIPDHTKLLEKLAGENNSWAGLSMVAELVAPAEPERKLNALEAFYASYSDGAASEEFLVEYTAVLGQCGLYDRIPAVIWRVKSARAGKPLSWKLQLHLAQAQIAMEQMSEARASLEALQGMKTLPASVIDTVIPALMAEINGINESNVISTGAKNEHH